MSPSQRPAAWSGLRGCESAEPSSGTTDTSTAPGRKARTVTPCAAEWGPRTAKGSPCSPVTMAWTASRERLMNVDPGPGTAGLEGADQALHPLVVALERVLAEDGLTLGVIELQVDPVHAVVLAFEVGLPDELAAQPRAGRLRRDVLGALDDVVARDAIHHVVLHELEVHALVGPDVVVLQVHERDLGVAPGQAMLLHEGLDDALLDDPIDPAMHFHGIRLQRLDDVIPGPGDVLVTGSASI